MWEESLTQFLDPEGCRKVGQREREKAQRVFERQSIRCQGKDLGPHGDLVCDFSMRVVTVFEDEHAVVSLEVVKDDNDVPIVPVLIYS